MKTDYRIDLAGSNATSRLRPFFSKVKVNDRDGTELDTATVTLSYSNRIAIPTRGTEIEIFLGYEGQTLFSVFKGIVNGVGVNGSPDQLFLKATGLALSDEKRLQSSTTRSWNGKTIGEIANEIISGAGFKARVHDRLSGIELKRYMQTLETDLELLQKLADAYGGFLKSDGETVAILPVRSQQSADGQNLPLVTVRHGRGENDISEYGWTTDYRNFAGTLIAYYQDDGRTKELKRGAGSPERKLKTVYSTESEASAAAVQEVEKYETQETFSFSTTGRDIAVGSALQVQGFPVPIGGIYWVRGVEHNLGNAYTVRVESER